MVKINFKKKFNKPFDTFFKTRKAGRVPFVAYLFNPEIKNVQNVSTELPNTITSTKFSDTIIETDDAIFIVEFQTGGIKIKDLHRFIVYYGLVLADKNYDIKAKKPVHVVVIYTEEVEKDYYYENGMGHFYFKTSSLKEYNADEYLEKIKTKIENEEKLTQYEKMMLELLPFFKSKRTPQDLLSDTIQLVSKDRFLTDTERTDIREGQMQLALGFSKNNTEFKEWIKMIQKNESLLDAVIEELGKEAQEKARKKVQKEAEEQKIKMQEEAEKQKIKMQEEAEKQKIKIRKEALKKGIEKGKGLGITSMVKSMLKRNYPIDEISSISGLSHNEIKNII